LFKLWNYSTTENTETTEKSKSIVREQERPHVL
jgi:hypothetical protein